MTLAPSPRDAKRSTDLTSCENSLRPPDAAIDALVAGLPGSPNGSEVGALENMGALFHEYLAAPILAAVTGKIDTILEVA